MSQILQLVMSGRRAAPPPLRADDTSPKMPSHANHLVRPLIPHVSGTALSARSPRFLMAEVVHQATRIPGCAAGGSHQEIGGRMCVHNRYLGVAREGVIGIREQVLDATSGFFLKKAPPPELPPLPHRAPLRI